MPDNDVLAAARHYALDLDLSIFPVEIPGKAPLKQIGSQNQYQFRRPSEREMQQWWGDSVAMPLDRDGQILDAIGIGLIAGGDNLVCIDFDDSSTYEPWCELVEQLGAAFVLAECAHVKTPGGYHVWVRTPAGKPAPPTANLARFAAKTWSEERQKDVTTRIELRGLASNTGQGSYAILPPTLGYEFIKRTSLDSVGQCTWDEWRIFMSAVAEFDLHRYDDERPQSRKEVKSQFKGDSSDLSPAEDFDQRHSIDDLMLIAGGQPCGRGGKLRHWTRPGKKSGVSAVSGLGDSENGIKIWSSNWPPFDQGEYLTPWGFLAKVKFGGDFRACVRYLREQGYGSQKSYNPKGGVDIQGEAVTKISGEELVPFSKQAEAGINWKAARNPFEVDGRHVMSDAGNAERFVLRHGHQFRYVPQFKQWMIWTGAYWEILEDGAATVKRYAIEVARDLRMEAEALKAEQPEQAEKLRKWAANSESLTKLNAMVDLARSGPFITAPAKTLDQGDCLLVTPNCTVDLRTGESRDCRREELATLHTPIEYDPRVCDCPKWMGFLRDIFAGDEDLIAFIQRLVGYSMRGTAEDQIFLYLHGAKGHNGKSQFIHVISSILGRYCMTVAPEVLMTKDRIKSSGPNPEVARLRAARMVTAAETGEGRTLDEDLIKTITGNDIITVRGMYQEPFEFKAKFVVWMFGNHKPRIRGSDDAIWRRPILIPFEVRIPDEKRIKDYGKIMVAEEGQAILSWAVRGAVLYEQEGLGERPAAVTIATQSYREEQDILGRWLRGALREDITGYETVEKIHAQYLSYARRTGEWAMPVSQFRSKMESRGYEIVEVSGELRANDVALVRQSVPERSYGALYDE